MDKTNYLIYFKDLLNNSVPYIPALKRGGLRHITPKHERSKYRNCLYYKYLNHIIKGDFRFAFSALTQVKYIVQFSLLPTKPKSADLSMMGQLCIPTVLANRNTDENLFNIFNNTY